MEIVTSMISCNHNHGTVASVVAGLAIALGAFWVLKEPPRTSVISPDNERVLVLGASSGVGRSIAHLYAQRGARVCVVGRRKHLLDEVVRECSERSKQPDDSAQRRVISEAADFSDVDDMVRLRALLLQEWQGVDTVVVAAGVSALQPIMTLAGVERPRKDQAWKEATAEGIKQSVDIATAAMKGNYVGPLVAAVTLIPLLTNSSTSPSIALISSVAGLVPAPTRALYASSKGASLLLYQSLAIEHPSIAFTFVLPGTVEGDFRASAVDAALGGVHEADPSKHGLRREVVASRVVCAVDRRDKVVWVPLLYRFAHALYWIWPSFIEGRASAKYNFNPSEPVPK